MKEGIITSVKKKHFFWCWGLYPHVALKGNFFQSGYTRLSQQKGFIELIFLFFAKDWRFPRTMGISQKVAKWNVKHCEKCLAKNGNFLFCCDVIKCLVALFAKEKGWRYRYFVALRGLNINNEVFYKNKINKIWKEQGPPAGEECGRSRMLRI